MEEAINMLPAEETTVETPTGETFTGLVITKMCCAVSVIRSGECMEEALRTVWRDVKVGKLFIRTNHTSLTPQVCALFFFNFPPCFTFLFDPQPVYINLPSDIKDRSVLLLEPMLATGVTSACALRILVSQGVPPSNIIHVSMLSTPAAIAFVHNAFPEVQLLTGEIDKGVDANSMIVPGLGNFGNRYFGTETE